MTIKATNLAGDVVISIPVPKAGGKRSACVHMIEQLAWPLNEEQENNTRKGGAVMSFSPADVMTPQVLYTARFVFSEVSQAEFRI